MNIIKKIVRYIAKKYSKDRNISSSSIEEMNKYQPLSEEFIKEFSEKIEIPGE